MTPIWTALIAALASLTGVTVGSVLEPIKLGAARRARIRDQLAEQCGLFVEAATMTRSRSLAINRLHRRCEHNTAYHEQVQAVIDNYWQARTELRRVGMLLQLIAPPQLAEQAMAVRTADRKLRKLQDRVGQDPDQRVPEVNEALGELETAVLRFIKLARAHTR